MKRSSKPVSLVISGGKIELDLCEDHAGPAFI